MSGGGDPEKVVTSVNLDKNHKEWINAQNKNLSGFVNDLIANYRDSGGDVDSAARTVREIQIESELEEAEMQQEMAEQKAERLRDELERLETHKDAAQQEYERELADILEGMEDGGKMWADAPRIQSLAEEFYGDQTLAPDVMDDLRERADDYEIDPDQFSEP